MATLYKYCQSTLCFVLCASQDTKTRMDICTLFCLGFVCCSGSGDAHMLCVLSVVEDEGALVTFVLFLVKCEGWVPTTIKIVVR